MAWLWFILCVIEGAVLWLVWEIATGATALDRLLVQVHGWGSNKTPEGNYYIMVVGPGESEGLEWAKSIAHELEETRVLAKGKLGTPDRSF